MQHRSILFDTVVESCRPVDGDNTYFRPFTCQHAIEKARIMLIGFSPKRRIDHAVPIEIVAKSCTDYAVLKKLIGEDSSKTRPRFEKMVPELSKAARGATVIETNAYAYPSLSMETAKRLPETIEKKCRKILVELIRDVHPRWIIVFGEGATARASDVLSGEQLVEPFKSKWQNIDYSVPLVIQLGTMTLDGQRCCLLATRHPGDQQHGGFPYTNDLFDRTCSDICRIIRTDCTEQDC